MLCPPLTVREREEGGREVGGAQHPGMQCVCVWGEWGVGRGLGQGGTL